MISGALGSVAGFAPVNAATCVKDELRLASMGHNMLRGLWSIKLWDGWGRKVRCSTYVKGTH